MWTRSRRTCRQANPPARLRRRRPRRGGRHGGADLGAFRRPDRADQQRRRGGPDRAAARGRPGELSGAIRATLVGAAFAAQAVLPAMLKAGAGRIVNLSSGAAHRQLEGWSAYCAAKAGLAMLTRSLALEYGERASRCSASHRAWSIPECRRKSGRPASTRSAASRRNACARIRPRRAIAFLCGPGGDAFAGQEIDIRDAAFRAAAGLA